MELDEEVLGLLAGEALTQDVRHRVDVVLVLNEGTNAQGARPLPHDHAPQPGRRLLIDHLGGVAGHVDERGTVSRQVLNEAHERRQVAASPWRDDLEADQRSGGAFEVFSDLHGACDPSRWTSALTPRAPGPVIEDQIGSSRAVGG